MSDDALEQRENLEPTKIPDPTARYFKKGNKLAAGNRTPEDIKQLRILSREEFERRANRALFMSIEELSKIKSDPKTTALDMMIVSVLIKAIKEGDEKRLNFLLDRLIGKVVQPLTLQPVKPPPEPIMIEPGKLSDEALNELMGVIDVTPVK